MNERDEVNCLIIPLIKAKTHTHIAIKLCSSPLYFGLLTFSDKCVSEIAHPSADFIGDP